MWRRDAATTAGGTPALQSAGRRRLQPAGRRRYGLDLGFWLDQDLMRVFSQRGVLVRVVCVLAMALVCAMGIAQAVHAHPEDSSAPHHVCSICSTAHAGLSTAMTFAPPVLGASPLAITAPESSGIFRSTEVHCIRPPPAV